MFRNLDIKVTCDNGMSSLERVDQTILKWFGNMDRRNKKRIEHKGKVDEDREGETPKWRWYEGVKKLVAHKA